MSAKQILNGSFGSLFINGTKIAQVKSVETKLNFSRTDVQFTGALGMDSKLISATGEGSFTLYKVNSALLQQVLPFVSSGRDLRLDLLIELDDPDSVGLETMAISGCWLNDLDLSSFEAGAMREEVVSFGFNTRNMKMLDAI